MTAIYFILWTWYFTLWLYVTARMITRGILRSIDEWKEKHG